MLIALEGIDGCGKTVVQRELNHRFPGLSLGFGGTPPPEDIPARFYQTLSAFKRNEIQTTDPLVRCFPFMLARAMAAGTLREAKATPQSHTFLDRYVMTNAAYAYTAARMNPSLGEDPLILARTVADLEFGVLGLPVPDLTLILRTSPISAHRRLVSDKRHRYDPSPEAKFETDPIRLAVLDYAFGNALRPLFAEWGAIREINTTLIGKELTVRQVVDQISEILEKEAR